MYIYVPILGYTLIYSPIVIIVILYICSSIVGLCIRPQNLGEGEPWETIYTAVYRRVWRLYDIHSCYIVLLGEPPQNLEAYLVKQLHQT